MIPTCTNPACGGRYLDADVTDPANKKFICKMCGRSWKVDDNGNQIAESSIDPAQLREAMDRVSCGDALLGMLTAEHAIHVAISIADSGGSPDSIAASLRGGITTLAHTKMAEVLRCSGVVVENTRPRIASFVDGRPICRHCHRRGPDCAPYPHIVIAIEAGWHVQYVRPDIELRNSEYSIVACPACRNKEPGKAMTITASERTDDAPREVQRSG